MLIDKYEKVDVKTMGFPENWNDLLEQKQMVRPDVFFVYLVNFILIFDGI